MLSFSNLDIDITPIISGRQAFKNYRPLCSIVITAVADLLTLLGVLSTFKHLDDVIGSPITPVSLIRFWLIYPILVSGYWIVDPHPGVSVCQTQEVKRIIITNGVASLCLLALLEHFDAPVHTQLAVLIACIVASFSIPIGRYLTRMLGARFAWWGHPVAILGAGEVAACVIRKLQLHPEMGMRPVAMATLLSHQRQFEGQCSFLRTFRQFNQLRRSGIRHAVIAVPHISRADFAELLERSHDVFPHVIVIPGLDPFWNTGGLSLDFHNLLAVSMQNNLLLPGSRLVKRVIDLIGCLVAICISVPLVLLLSIFIFLDSGRPIFFSQRRLGKNGKTFRIWKFRTMVRNAEELKQFYLAQHPDMSKEWVDNQKLKVDPRITRLGQFIRKTSLDELPQLWNVLKGDMSLVGPRPIIYEEVPRYGNSYALYVKTTPGLTGLWQVSGRNRTTYEERVACDAFYVRNWSLWLDVCVLAKTVLVILIGDGAC